MNRKQWLAKAVFFPILNMGSFLVGWMIPTFYDWSGADQSHSTPSADQAVYSLIGFGVLAWLVIPWLPRKDASVDEEGKPFQFHLRVLLAITSLVAISIAGLTNFPVAFCVLLWVVGFVAATRIIANELSWRWQLATLLACMYFPFAWVLFSGEFKELSFTTVCGAIGLPAFLPSLFVGALFDQHVAKTVWLWGMLVACEIAIGLWLIRLGPRRTIAYFVLVMLTSTIGSMVLNALMRM